MTCTHTHEHGVIPSRPRWMNHQVSPLLQCRTEKSPLRQALGNSQHMHCRAPCGLISQEQGRLAPARLCAAMTCALGASWPPVWMSGVFSLGCIIATLQQGWRLYWCTTQMHLGGSSDGGFWSLPLIMAH